MEKMMICKRGFILEYVSNRINHMTWTLNTYEK